MATAEVESPRAQPLLGQGQDGRLPKGRRRWAAPAAFTALGLALFFAYLAEADKLPIFADGASQALQAQDMLHGNLLLHGWVLSDVSFYTTEVPQYLLIELVTRMNPDVVHIAAAMTYSLLVVLTAVLAKGRATGREALVRVLICAGIMFAPAFGRILFSLGYSPAWILLSAPDHTGTQVPLILTWLVLDRARPKWWLPLAIAALLTWVEIADSTAIFEGALPIVAVCAVRMYRRRGPWRGQRHDFALAAGALASAGVAIAALRLIRTHGGFAVNPAPPVFSTITGLTGNFWVKVNSVLTVFGADFFGQPATRAVIPVLHLVAVAVVIWAVARAVRQFLSLDDDLATQVLTASFIFLLASFMLGYRTGAREAVGLLPIGAALAGRMLARRVFQQRLAAALAAVLACLAFSLAVNVLYPALPNPGRTLAGWLEAHHLKYGLSATWYASNGVTLYSGNEVQVRDVKITSRGQLTRIDWNTKASWYNPRRHDATFLIFNPCAPTLTDSLYRNYGRPAATYLADGFTVAVWNENLLASHPPVRAPPRKHAGPRRRTKIGRKVSASYQLMCNN